MMETVERISYEQYAAAELVIADREISAANWSQARFTVDERNPRVLLGRDPAGRAPGGLHTTDRPIELSDDERLAATALALVRQPYDHRWLLHVVAGTHEPGSPHRVVIDAAGQQHLLGPDGTLLLVQDQWYRIRLAQDPTGPITRHSDAERIATTHLVEEVWLKVKTPQQTGQETVDLATYYISPRADRRVERKRAFILAHAYGPVLAGLTDQPETASTLAARIATHYRECGRYPEDFLLSVPDGDPLLNLSDEDMVGRQDAVQRICNEEIRKAGVRVRAWIVGEQRRTGERGEVPSPSSIRFAQWLQRLGVVTIQETLSGHIKAVVPIHPVQSKQRFATYTLARR